MAFAYKITEQKGLYFVTFTVKDWIDIFTRNEYRQIVVDSLNHCITHKGLEVYAWVIMTNHLHLIISSSKDDLSDIIRDFKKFTSKKLVEAIEQNKGESRSRWLLKKKEGETETITLWQPGNHPEEIRTEKFYKQKMQYIHQNPVRAGWVTNEEEYKWSSAVIFMAVARQCSCAFTMADVYFYPFMTHLCENS